MSFVPGLNHVLAAEGVCWLLATATSIYVEQGIWLFSESKVSALKAGRTPIKVGQWCENNELLDCYCLPFETAEDVDLAGEWRPLRSFLLEVSETEFLHLGAAAQLANWFHGHRFCGCCGGDNEMLNDDRALYCQACDSRQYPRLSPCIIALITRGDECLLAVHHRSPGEMFTALAGFIEGGESAEAAVVREVMEEVGLKVGHSRYICSQPWPFPHQLMLGFFTSYISGDISLQDDELAQAQWFHYQHLPPLIPPSVTLSGQLIRQFVAERESANTGTSLS